MGSLAQIIGWGWAAIGVYYLYSLVKDHGGDDMTIGLGFMIAMIVFILPGLAVGSIGSMASNKGKEKSDS